MVSETASGCGCHNPADVKEIQRLQEVLREEYRRVEKLIEEKYELMNRVRELDATVQSLKAKIAKRQREAGKIKPARKGAR